MPLALQGSCHCQKVTYSVESHTPVPYQLCQCSICRKAGGYMGSVNIMGDNDTLKLITGESSLKTYNAVLTRKADGSPDKIASSKRYFCGDCSSMLWLHDEEWAHWIYPYASSIDTPLPLPSSYTDSKTNEAQACITIMRDSCPDYVPVPEGTKVYGKYGPGKGIEEWHKANGAWVD